jgi:hypothetical protein
MLTRRSFLNVFCLLGSRTLLASPLSNRRDLSTVAAVIPSWWRQPTVNVTSYGASTLAAASKNIAAFRRAEAALPTGGRIFVPSGAYDMTARTSADAYTIGTSGIEIAGEGDATILLNKSAEAYSGQLFGIINVGNDINPAADIRLHNFKLQGPQTHTGELIPEKAPQLVNGICINLSPRGKAIGRVSLQGITVTRLMGCGFQISGGDVVTGGTFDTLIDGCLATDNRNDGFNVIGGNVFSTTATNNQALYCDGFGFEMAGAGMLIANNVIRHCGQSGIGLELNPIYGKNRRTVIRENVIEDCFTGGYPDTSGISLGQTVKPFNVDIVNNQITRVGGNGIDGGPAGGSDIVIDGNNIKDIGKNNRKKWGIDLTSPSGVQIRNNRIVAETPGFHMDYGIVMPGIGSETNTVGPNTIAGASKGKHSVGKGTRVVN